MARRKRGAKSRTPSRAKARSKTRLAWWPNVAARRRFVTGFSSAPAIVQVVAALAIAVAAWFVANGLYQVIRKPSELFFPVSGTLHKTPTETWDAYGTLFRRHSTDRISPEFLAALAQMEGSGNPIVRTYWRFTWKPQPFEIYRPASSAVGMYQITNGTFGETRQLCIHDHRVVRAGRWDDWDACWFNALYTRTVPSHAVEMTSAYLDDRVGRTLRRAGRSSATTRQMHDLAAVIHLCGAGAGERFARRGLSPSSGQKCGDHDVRAYIAKMNAMKGTFRKLAAKS